MTETTSLVGVRSRQQGNSLPRRPTRKTPLPPTNVVNPFRKFCGDEERLWKEIKLTSGLLPSLKEFVETFEESNPNIIIRKGFQPNRDRAKLLKWLPLFKQYYTDLWNLGDKWGKTRLPIAAQQLYAMSTLLNKPEEKNGKEFLEKVHQHVQGLIKPPPSPKPKLDRLASMRTFASLHEKVRRTNSVKKKRTHSVGGKKSSSTRERSGSLPTLRRKDTPSQKTNEPKNPFQEFTERTQAFYENMTALYTTLHSMETIQEFVHAKSMSDAIVLFKNLKLRLNTLLTSEEMVNMKSFLKGFNPTMSTSDADKGLLPWTEYYTLIAKLHLAAHLFGGCASFSGNKTLEAPFRLCSERLTQLPMQFDKMIERLNKPENVAAKGLLSAVKSHIQELLQKNNQWLAMAASFSQAALDDKPPEFDSTSRTVVNTKDLNSAVERIVDTTRSFYHQIDQLNLALQKIEDRHVHAFVLAKKKGSHKKQKETPLKDKDKSVLFLLNGFKDRVSYFAKSLERMMVSTLLGKISGSLQDSNFLMTFPERMRNYYGMIRDIRTYAYVFNACATFSKSNVDIARIMNVAQVWLTEEPYHWQVLLSKVEQGSAAHEAFSKVAQILKKDIAKTPYDLGLLFAYRDALPKKNKLVSAPLNR